MSSLSLSAGCASTDALGSDRPEVSAGAGGQGAGPDGQAAGGTGGAFVHPGILTTTPQLDFVKQHITADPWATQYARVMISHYSKLTYTASPVAVIRAGDGTDVGATAARDDALAAYTQALIWAYTGDKSYAANAVAILDAWSAVLSEIAFDASVPNDKSQNSGPLEAAWLGELFPRSAEILRYTDSGWPAANAERFGRMLTTVILPHVLHKDGWDNIGSADWELSMADAAINIGVYNDDHASFDAGVAAWRDRAKANVYLTSDGAAPPVPARYATASGGWPSGKLATTWAGQSTFGAAVEGLTQQACGSTSIAQLALAASVDAAETAYLQGVDLYAEGQDRLLAAHEFLAGLLNGFSPSGDILTSVNGMNGKAEKTDAAICGGTIAAEDDPTWEIVYNHYVNRRGLAMPQTRIEIARLRKANLAPVNLHLVWETLTHAESGQVVLPEPASR